MTLFLTLIHIVVCFVLIIVILVQGGRGQGLTSNFSSGNVQSLFGTRAADFLTKATTVSAILFLFTCLGLNVLEARKSRSLLDGTQQAAPVDIDAVKKALEKVAEENKAAAPSVQEAENQAAQEAVQATAPAKAAVEGPVAEAQKAAEALQESAPASPAPAAA